MELKEKILEACIQVYKQKGLKFTMDDIAASLSISKKTIYTVFENKEQMFLAMVDYLFDQVKADEASILEADDLSTLEKIRQILTCLPRVYADVEFSHLHSLRNKYPKIYAQVERRLETGWEATIGLLEQGMQEGVVRPISIPIFKLMFEASLEQFFARDVLEVNQIPYRQALDQVAEILISGIAMKEELKA